MKAYNYLFLVPALVVLAACGGSGKKGAATQAKLDSLKKVQAELAVQIKEVEAALAIENPETASNAKVTYVSVSAVAAQEFLHCIEIQGNVVSNENINVTAKIPGVVTVINVSEGQQVKKGQVLAETDASIYKANLVDLETNYELIKNVFQRQENLWKQQIGTEMQYLNAKTQKESMEKKIAALKEQIEFTKVKSPINGTVDLVVAKLGEAVNPGFPAFRVVNPSALKAKADVAESFASKVKKGDDVILSFPDINKEYRTRLTYAAKVIDPMKRTFSVESKLDNNSIYRPNMVSVFKIIDYRNRNAVVVPVNVVQHTDGNDFVYVGEGEGKKLTVVKKNVTLGMTYNNLTEIKSGLAKGDKLITQGFQNINEGEQVQLD